MFVAKHQWHHWEVHSVPRYTRVINIILNVLLNKLNFASSTRISVALWHVCQQVNKLFFLFESLLRALLNHDARVAHHNARTKHEQ